MNWYIDVLKKYAVFDGRARRKEYWYFTLFNILIMIGLVFVDAAMGTLDAQSGYGALGVIYTLGVIIPSIAALVRRLHDIGRSGWWVFIILVPLIGPIAILIMTVMSSYDGTNEYGSNPITESA